jgi:phosphate/sulfate permease
MGMAAAAEKAHSRWYRLTPDRVVVALLALEGFLLLSAWFRWFPFNQYKGWTVLVAIAGVGAAMLLMFLWFLAAVVFRWRFQFSILSLLVLTVVVAIPCSWLATEMKAARRQREAVEEIEKAGGKVTFEYQANPRGRVIPRAKGPPLLRPPRPGAKPQGPPWLRMLLGDDIFVSVTEVDLSGSRVSDTGLERLEGLPQLRKLWLTGTEVGDVGLQHLEGLTQLGALYLGGTKVGDAGVEHLKGLTQLKELSVWCTRVTDAGLEHLEGLTQLRWLDLNGAQVTDAGLKYLKGLTRLEEVRLMCTRVTDAGVRDLQKALPKAKLISP